MLNSSFKTYLEVVGEVGVVAGHQISQHTHSLLLTIQLFRQVPASPRYFASPITKTSVSVGFSSKKLIFRFIEALMFNYYLGTYRLTNGLMDEHSGP